MTRSSQEAAGSCHQKSSAMEVEQPAAKKWEEQETLPKVREKGREREEKVEEVKLFNGTTAFFVLLLFLAIFLWLATVV